MNNHLSPFKVPEPKVSSEFPSQNSSQRVSDNDKKKVPLEPGYSAMSWMLTAKGIPMPKMKRYTVNQLSEHTTKEDCWTSINGKVYNITPYLRYHPGGIGQIMRSAGKESTGLFNQVHSWVNVDKLLENCFVGYLLPAHYESDNTIEDID